MITLNISSLRNVALGLLVAAVGTAMLVYFRGVQASEAMASWEAVGYMGRLAILFTAVFIWLRGFSWRGAGIRYLLIAKCISNVGLILLMTLCGVLGAPYRDAFADFFIFLPLDMALLVGLCLRRDWSRKLPLAISGVGLVVLALSVSSLSTHPDRIWTACSAALLCYLLAHPEVKREFAWAL